MYIHQANKWPTFQSSSCLLTNTPCMMTPSNGNILRETGPLWGESTGHKLIPLAKATDAELWCLLWPMPEQKVEQIIEPQWFKMPSHPWWRHCKTGQQSHGYALKSWKVYMSYLWRLCHCHWHCHIWETGREGNVYGNVIKWKHFARNWPFVRGIHLSQMDSPHKGQ